MRDITDLFYYGTLKLFHEFIRDFFSDRDLIDVDANLTAVADLKESNLSCGIIQISVLSDYAPVACFAS